MKKNVYIGTSGFYYDHWIDNYYPNEIKSQDFLSFYAKDFSTVEIDSSFYRLPTKETVESWKEKVDPHFLFSVKASQYITHIKRLKDPRRPLKKFFSIVDLLKKQLAVTLFQLPPQMKIDLSRLSDFLQMLPKKHLFSFEFRNPTWFNDAIYRILSDHNVAFCIYDLEGKTTPKIITANFTYVRLHGPKRAYSGLYSNRLLSQWAKDFQKWAKRGIKVFCYFNNDEKGYAPKNAISLQKQLGKK
ncbi:MAG: DUF72 domain-containing protein [Chlamydiae bacterium]|nr:DUF72 domain-containing protein [Chlamydiota bacterium]